VKCKGEGKGEGGNLSTILFYRAHSLHCPLVSPLPLTLPSALPSHPSPPFHWRGKYEWHLNTNGGNNMENTKPAKKKEDPGNIIKTKLYYVFPILVIVLAGIRIFMSLTEPLNTIHFIWLILNSMALAYGIVQVIFLNRFYKKYDALDKIGSLTIDVKEFISQQISYLPIFMFSILCISVSDSSEDVTALRIIGLVTYFIVLILGFYVTKKMFTGIDRKMSNT
jgi:hypothetical protein